jgi:hypothetical protein
LPNKYQEVFFDTSIARDRGSSGQNAAEAAQQHGIRLEVVKHRVAKRGFVLLAQTMSRQRFFTCAPASQNRQRL